MKLTGAAILVSRGMKVLQAAPAAYPCRYVAEASWPGSKDQRRQLALSSTNWLPLLTSKSSLLSPRSDHCRMRRTHSGTTRRFGSPSHTGFSVSVTLLDYGSSGQPFGSC